MPVPLGPWTLKNPRESKVQLGVGIMKTTVITDTDEKAHLFLSGGALHHRMGTTKDDIPTLSITHAGLDALNLKQKTVADLRKDGLVKMSSNPLKIKAFFDLIEEPEYWFEIVRP